MHEEIYVYTVPLPDRVHECVVPCLDGFTVYIDENMTHEQQLEKYRHAVRHIRKGHFNMEDVQAIEAEAHGKE